VPPTPTDRPAGACPDDIQHHAPGLKRLIVCGGGALNGYLMQRLQALLPQAQVVSSAEAGLPPLEVEATAFAWLARKCLRGESLELKSTTGAKGARVLGGIWPA
jgi:anhydro-N-acetylmuramic acid kinase